VRFRKETAKPTIANARIAKVEIKKGRLKEEKISKKRKMKIKPKIILKLVLTRKSNEAKGSLFLVKVRINLRIPEPTKYRVNTHKIENRTESNKVILAQSNHIISLP
jgi:hypothetical protein